MLQVIRRAVERIDDPRPPAGALETHTAFFAEDRVVRAVFANQGDDRGFAFAVRARHPVIARFQVGVFFSELLPMRQQNVRAEARRVACKLNIIFPGGHRGKFYCSELGYARSDPCKLVRSRAIALGASSAQAAWARAISPKTRPSTAKWRSNSCPRASRVTRSSCAVSSARRALRPLSIIRTSSPFTESDIPNRCT